MGMYTRLQLDVEIYPDFVQEVEEYINSVGRLRCTSHYFYDRGENRIERDEYAKCLRNPTVEPKPENTALMAVLHTDISCKNYGGEIQAFLEFLNGKVVFAGAYSGEHIGSIRYEEDRIPDLVFQEGSKLVVKKIKVLENGE